MALFLSPGYAVFSLLCFSALSIESVDHERPPFSLSFEKFENDKMFGSEIALYGDAEVRNSTVLMFGKGRMMCRKPFRFFGTNPGFSTYFSFSVSAGYGQNLAFLLVPSNVSRAEVNPGFLVVKFAVAGAGASSIAFDVGGAIPVKSGSLSVLNSEEKLHSWIDYDGASKMIGVKISKSRDLKPEKSLVSCPVDLSNTLWREAMYVGIGSSGGGASRTSNVYSWSFNVTQGAPYQMHSQPLNPDSVTVRSYEDPSLPMTRSSPWKITVALVVGVIFGALLASAVFFLRSRVVRRHPVSPTEYESEEVVSDGFKGVDVAGK